MKKIAETKTERLITLELTDGELAYIVAAMGEVSPVQTAVTASSRYPTNNPVHSSNGHNFHESLIRVFRGGK